MAMGIDQMATKHDDNRRVISELLEGEPIGPREISNDCPPWVREVTKHKGASAHNSPVCPLTFAQQKSRRS